MINHNIELLSPAGDMERLKLAVKFGIGYGLAAVLKRKGSVCFSSEHIGKGKAVS